MAKMVEGANQMCVEKGDSQGLPILLKRRQRSSKWDEISVELNGTAVVYTKVNDKVDICSYFQWLGFSNEIPLHSLLHRSMYLL